MRPALRLLAAVQRSSQFLEPGAPTGLTGLATHSAPRSTLLYLYSTTLEKLNQFPESSVYRQSAEALTKHRLAIIEAVKPAGLEQWQQRVHGAVEENPQAFRKVPLVSGGSKGDYNIVWKAGATEGLEEDEAKPKKREVAQFAEGPRWGEAEANEMVRQIEIEQAAAEAEIPQIEPEPALTAEQIGEIESKIGAGLIEEVIQVAEGERELAETLCEHKVWEDLEVKPTEGQWTYYERDRHTPTTQSH